MISKKKIVVCASHEGGMLAIQSLVDHSYAISAIVCLDEIQAQKYNVSGYLDYRPFAEKYNIPIYIPETYTLDSANDLAFFENGSFDILVQGGWQRLFPEKVLKTLSIGALGLHGSADLLPKGRGRSPLNWSLIEGRKRFIMHLFMIKPGVDDGDVVGIKDFDITDYDDIETLYFKYAIVYRDLLIENLPALFSGRIEPLPQKGEPSYYPKRTAEDGRIDWEEMDVREIYNFIRAQTRPYPGAFGTIDGAEVKIWNARPFDTRILYPNSSYGAIVEMFGDKIIVNCRGGLLLIDDWEKMV